MIRVCSWCEEVLGGKPLLDEQGTAYGVCPACSTRRRRPKSTVGPALDPVERVAGLQPLGTIAGVPSNLTETR